MEKSISAIQSDLDEIKARMEKCYQMLSKANPEQKKKLDEIYNKLEAGRDRLAIALDILSGRDYTLHDIDGELVVARPSANTAKLIKAAEEHGARVTKVSESKKPDTKPPGKLI